MAIRLAGPPETESEAPSVTVLGLDDPGDLRPSALACLQKAEVVAGPERLLRAAAPGIRGESLPMTGGLDDWLEKVSVGCRDKELVLLADGDPNFFGLGAKAVKAFPGRRISMRPALTAVQKAFALLGVTWAGVETVSLHGRRDYGPFFSAVFRAGRPSGPGRLAVYTDRTNDPAMIASKLAERGQNGWTLAVFQDLGLPGQSVWRGSQGQAAKESFSPLNLVVLELAEPPEPLTLGAPETAYDHEAGLITKSEVRTAALGLLELRGDETMWDLGCGSGSVSLEAGLILRRGQIHAVEKDPRRAWQARLNRSRYGMAHLDIVEGRALEVFPDLPRPDRVFIGGGGQELEALMQGALGCLAPGGVVVAAVVRLDGLDAALSSLSATGLPLSVTQISASRGKPLAGSLILKPINPVFLIKGRVQGERRA
jgi:precorrin-6Y C5,15-methyltransferase (decarboxylating)